MAIIWHPFIKRGNEPIIEDMKDHTFEDFAAENDVKIKDLTFDPNLTDISFTGKSKSSATYTPQNKNSTTFTSQTKNL